MNQFVQTLSSLGKVVGKLVLGLVTAVYLVVARGFLFLLALYVAGYFISGTSAVRLSLEDAVNQGIPGTLTMGGLQWGPLPGQLTIADLAVKDPEEQGVLQADVVAVDVDLLATLAGWTHRLISPRAPVPFIAHRVSLVRPRARLAQGKEGLGLMRAFARPRDAQAPPSPPANLDIRLRHLVVHGGDLLMEYPGTRVEVGGAELYLSRFSILGPGLVRFSSPKPTVERIDLDLQMPYLEDTAPEGLTIPARGVEFSQVVWSRDGLSFYDLKGDVDGGQLSGSGRLSFGAEGTTWKTLQNVVLQMPASSRLLEILSKGSVMGAFRFTAEGKGDLKEAHVSGRLETTAMRISGIPVDRAVMDLSIEPEETPYGARTHRFDIHSAELQMLEGTVFVSRARWRPRWATRNEEEQWVPTRSDFGATLEVDGLNPWGLVPAPSTAVALALPFLDGASRGNLEVSGHIRNKDDLLRVQVDTERLELRWPTHPKIPLHQVFAISGGVSWEQGLKDVGGETERILRLRELRLENEQDRLRLNGDLDLARKKMKLQGSAHVHKLDYTLGALGVKDLYGQMDLKALQIKGPFTDPTGHVDLVWSRARTGDIKLGRVTGRINLDNGRVGLADGEMVAPWGKAELDAHLQVWKGNIRTLDPRMPFRVRRLAVRNLALHKLRPSWNITSTLTLDGRNLSGDAMDPLGTLMGEAVLRGADLRLGPERFKTLKARLRGNKRTVSLDQIAIVLERGHRIDGSLTMNKANRHLQGKLRTDGLPFDAFATFGEEGLPLKGRVSTNLHAEGTLANPTIIGSMRLDDFGFGNVAFGDGAFALTPGDDGRVDLSATENFPELVLLDGSYLEMKGSTPTKLVIRANAEKADIYRILPFMRVPDTDLKISGLVEYDQWFGPPPQGQEAWEIRADSLPGDVILSLYDGETVYRSQSPFYMVYGPQGTHLESLTMGTHVDDSLTVCGKIDADLQSDLRVSGRINLSALRPLRSAFSVLEGAAMIGSDPLTGKALGENRCLPSQDNRVLWVTGSILHPVLSGKVVTKGVQMIPRNFGQEIRVADGVGPVFRRTDDPDVQQILMPKSNRERIHGEVDDASFGMWGEMTLRRFALDSMDMGFVGTDVFFSSPGEYNMTFNPELRLVAEHMTEPEKRRLHLSGDARISEGSYYKSFDRFAKALNAVGQQQMETPESYAEPLTERVPWLKDLTMNLTASTADFAVRSLFPMGSTDLETRFDLRIAGTLDDMEIYNRLEILPGGTILYKVIRREFEIVQGTMDFTGEPMAPTLDVEAQTEVSYMPDTTAEDQVQSERTVTVSIRISGPPDNLQLAMWSRDNPNLTDADLQSLILTGRPRDEAASIQDRVGLSINFGKLVNDIIKSPIVEALNVTVGTESVSTRMIYRLGRAVKLRTRVIQDATETRVSAGFQFELSDALSLEGALQRTDRTTNPSQTYEAKFKYRIPVE